MPLSLLLPRSIKLDAPSRTRANYLQPHPMNACCSRYSNWRTEMSGKLTHFAAVATKEWRDVLYWAEEPRQTDEPRSWDELKTRLRLPDS